MQRTYELMFIVRPDMPEEDQDKLISNLETQVGTAGGTVKSVERMGKRRLAYTVRKFQDGIYMLMVLEGEGGMVKEVERRLRVTEPVIKFITVRVDEEQKRLAKIKALRDTKVRGRAPVPLLLPRLRLPPRAPRLLRLLPLLAVPEAPAAVAQEAPAPAAAPETAPAEGAESTPVSA